MLIKDIFKIKEYKENITRLEKDNQEFKQNIQEKTKIIEELALENQRYKSVWSNDHERILDLREILKNLEIKEKELNNSIENKNRIENELEVKINKLKTEIIVLEDEILYQSFNLYTPLYKCMTSEEYKNKIEEVREKQKYMIKNKEAVKCTTTWTVNGSIVAGRKMASDNIKQMIRSFNIECENAIDKVKFNNFDSMKNRIYKSFLKLNELNEINNIYIEEEYLNLKYQELNLIYEYELKKQEEKDEIKALKEIQREEAKLAKEIEEKRKEIEKEQQHYDNVLQKIDEQINVEKSEERLKLLKEKRNDILNNLVDLDKALKEIDYREANQKAGYVYVISNIGAFGNNVFKIGMTRRLEPQDRIDELSNASVPFKFDIHAMIFTEDAPKLENILHKTFEKRRINMVNNRKEFFNVTIEEIEEVIKKNYDKTVEFIKMQPAQQYRETIRLKNNFN